MHRLERQSVVCAKHLTCATTNSRVDICVRTYTHPHTTSHAYTHNQIYINTHTHAHTHETFGTRSRHCQEWARLRTTWTWTTMNTGVAKLARTHTKGCKAVLKLLTRMLSCQAKGGRSRRSMAWARQPLSWQAAVLPPVGGRLVRVAFLFVRLIWGLTSLIDTAHLDGASSLPWHTWMVCRHSRLLLARHT
jgi:hypothetical protein